MASGARKKVDVELARFIERAMRRLTLRVWQVLTVETPVRTGFARAKWSPSTGTPDRSGKDSPSVNPGKKGSDNFNLVQSQAAALLTTHKKATDALVGGYKLKNGVVFIVNNTKYIGSLNAGTSAQAPEMFVETGIAIALKRSRADLGG